MEDIRLSLSLSLLSLPRSLFVLLSSASELTLHFGAPQLVACCFVLVGIVVVVVVGWLSVAPVSASLGIAVVDARFWLFSAALVVVC